MATSTLGSGTLVLAGTTSGTTTVTATAVAGTTTLTLPAATDTLVGKATTDTLTNKTLTSPTLTGVVTFDAGTAAAPAITTTGDTNTGIFFPAADTIAFVEGGAETARFDSSSNLLVGTTSLITAQTGVASKHNISTTTGTAFGLTVSNSSTEAFGLGVKYTNASPNNAGSSFLWCADSGGTQRAAIYSNGGLANYSANNVNLSDQRVKKDIQNAGSYLAKICAIPVRTFLYKDQTDSLLNLGVIAQEVEAIAPELVDIQGFGDTTPDDGIPLKAIYQTDLQYALMKCIQEQQTLITTLTARITALETA